MSAALRHPTTGTRRPGKKVTNPAASSQGYLLANADRARDWLHREATGNGLTRVYIQDSSIPSWKEKEKRERQGNLSVSRGLRAFYGVLHDLRQSYQDCRLAFISLNFSEAVARQMAARARNEDRPLATIYGKRVTRRLNTADIPAAFFSIIEDTGGHRRADRLNNPFSGLHVHVLIAYHVEDEDRLKAVFRRDKNDTDNGMMWQQTYHEKWKGLDDFNDYPELDAQGNRYRVALVDGGAADYTSKDLQKHSRHLPADKSRVYCPNDLRNAAEERYERRRRRVTKLDRHRRKLAGCTLHEVLSLVLNDRIPGRRDPEPVYDWEYEESAEDGSHVPHQAAGGLRDHRGPDRLDSEEAGAGDPAGARVDARLSGLPAAVQLMAPQKQSPRKIAFCSMPTRYSSRGDLKIGLC